MCVCMFVHMRDRQRRTERVIEAAVNFELLWHSIDLLVSVFWKTSISVNMFYIHIIIFILLFILFVNVFVARHKRLFCFWFFAQRVHVCRT